MFNLKKNSQINNVDKRLEENRKDRDTESNDNTGNLDWVLSEDRDDVTGDKITEKQLDDMDKRVGSNGTILEKTLDNDPDGLYNKNRDDIDTPLMDMSKECEKAFIEAFNKVQDKVSEEDTWQFPIKPGSQMTGPGGKKVPVTQRSQLLSNYENREDMLKANSCVKKTEEMVSLLKDADAMLFHIYAKASQEDREINQSEKAIIDQVNREKIDILKEMDSFNK